MAHHKRGKPARQRGRNCLCNPHQARLGNTRAKYFVTPEQKREALMEQEVALERETRPCAQCSADFIVETGATGRQGGRRRQRSERFCSDSCAEAYDQDYEDSLFLDLLDEVL